MRIGILSDTHTGRPLDELGPQPEAFLSSVDLIMHTGDVTAPAVLDWLEQFAPLFCTGGNNDLFEDPRLQDRVIMKHEGWRIGAAHIVLDTRHNEPDRIAAMKLRGYDDATLDILIAGDTHYERLEYADGTLLLNSGSARLPRNMSVRLGSAALLELTRDHVHAEIVRLGESEGLRNPTCPAYIDFNRQGLLSASIDGVSLDIGGGEVLWPGPAPRDQM